MAELIKTSINSDGTPYNGGKGYKSGYRLNSSGVETAQNGVAVTGFMPVSLGDEITFSNMTIPAGNGISGCAYCYIAFYNSSFSLINSYYGYVWYANYPLRISPYETVEYSGKAGNYILKSITVNINNSNVAYMRVSALDMTDSSTITNGEAEGGDAMAVKASATVTLTSVVDVKSVWRYYKLQASTLSAPSKPTANPPSGWTTTEPSYTDGSTNSLYFVDLTVFSDDTFSYSDVSLSSSYEAAKAAYNKAVAAGDTAQGAKDAVDDLVTRVTDAETSIENNTEAITLRATKTEVTEAISDLETTISETYTTQTEFTQTSDEIRMDFNTSIQNTSKELSDVISDNAAKTNTRFTEINKYIRFIDGKIVLGETDNELMLTIQNDRVSFTQGGVEVAYFSNNNLYISRAEVLTTLKVGNYEFAPRNDGGLALRKRSE